MKLSKLNVDRFKNTDTFSDGFLLIFSRARAQAREFIITHQF